MRHILQSLGSWEIEQKSLIGTFYQYLSKIHRLAWLGPYWVAKIYEFFRHSWLVIFLEANQEAN